MLGDCGYSRSGLSIAEVCRHKSAGSLLRGLWSSLERWAAWVSLGHYASGELRSLRPALYIAVIGRGCSSTLLLRDLWASLDGWIDWIISTVLVECCFIGLPPLLVLQTSYMASDLLAEAAISIARLHLKKCESIGLCLGGWLTIVWRGIQDT